MNTYEWLVQIPMETQVLCVSMIFSFSVFCLIEWAVRRNNMKD
jgi:hypothetical protein